LRILSEIYDLNCDRFTKLSEVYASKWNSLRFFILNFVKTGIVFIFASMNEIELIDCCLLGVAIGISALCGLVLRRGGFVTIDAIVENEEGGGKPTQLQKALSAWAFFLSFLYVGYFAAFFLLDSPNPRALWVLDILSSMSLAIIVINALLLQQVKLTKKHWLLFILSFAPFLLLAVMLPIEYITVFLCADFLLIVLVVGASIYSLYRLNQWDQKIQNYYSDIIYKQTEWYRRLMIPYLGLSFSWLLMFFWQSYELYFVYLLGIIWVLIRTTECALKQEEFSFDAQNLNDTAALEEVNDTTEQTTKPYHRSATNMEEAPLWFEKMESMLRNDGLYRKADLTVVELAKIVGTNRTYISQYLNEHLKTTFFEYISKYRLDESEQLLREGKLGITEIAVRVGFKDRNAFYRVFRMRHNCSPSEWVKREK